ncbi:MAG: hypothetical protein IKD76_05450 [Clostridia bacterium]|uniref:Uncharacterized protein n=2 Tax=Bacillus cereus group TaxID=86661 RepID=A0A9W4EU73_BACTO|nr:hypothetical protein BCB4264_A2915 [Bacillus cereus B4264]ALZ61368.1 hypothetical protein FORC13_2307 [Bacillus cereus]MBR2786918.1 hypothetical protein [Clostridia bacterium]CCW05219.1 hypothetical protein EBGED10_19410 [Bacillus sp. GeD10]SDI09469.1 hypothetical protein SAMN04488578_104262 [Bacillus sp. cl96]SEA47102.1 hypothetical protein SAMN04488575_104262 [Bacillus sp. cl115]SHI88953.1 hypothetical protein SAMN04488576_101262 [Bacillus sp. cl25]BAR83922.1 hypothetical protein KNN_03
MKSIDVNSVDVLIEMSIIGFILYNLRYFLVFIKYISHVLNEKEYENKGYFCGRFLK